MTAIHKQTIIYYTVFVVDTSCAGLGVGSFPPFLAIHFIPSYPFALRPFIGHQYLLYVIQNIRSTIRSIMDIYVTFILVALPSVSSRANCSPYDVYLPTSGGTTSGVLAGWTLWFPCARWPANNHNWVSMERLGALILVPITGLLCESASGGL